MVGALYSTRVCCGRFTFATWRAEDGIENVCSSIIVLVVPNLNVVDLSMHLQVVVSRIWAN